MDLPSDFLLGREQKMFIKKIKGYSMVEIKRHPDPVMDNIIEIWSYDSRKKTKGDSSWVTDKDLLNHISYYRTLGFTEISIETNNEKRTKIK